MLLFLLSALCLFNVFSICFLIFDLSIVLLLIIVLDPFVVVLGFLSQYFDLELDVLMLILSLMFRFFGCFDFGLWFSLFVVLDSDVFAYVFGCDFDLIFQVLAF